MVTKTNCVSVSGGGCGSSGPYVMITLSWIRISVVQ
jgi:hypothetical protein